MGACCISINIIFSAVAFVIPGHYGAVPTTSNNFTQGWVSLKIPKVKDEFDKEGALKSMLRKLWLGCLCFCLISTQQPQPDVRMVQWHLFHRAPTLSESTESVVSMFPGERA